MLSGHVTDTTNTPIPLVNVFLTKGEGTSITNYTYTDAAGYYRLEVTHAGEYVFNVNGLSYSNYSSRIKIDSLVANSTFTKEIILIEKPQHLDEVVVNANLPILVKKDTVVIRVASYINGSEDVAEDILKKLPGIEVASDGTVKVQGRNVEKVMIEGDDLFEKGYKLLTKNLNAGVIDKVEILQHFSDNPLLKNIEDSEDIALNIVLKEEVKGTLFGNIDLGYGFKNVYENKLNIISIKKKTKYYVFGNMNTIGNDATGDIFQLLYPDYLTGNTYIGDGISAPKIMSMSINQPNIESSRFNFNEAELACINGIFNPSEKLRDCFSLLPMKTIISEIKLCILE
ncbi:MAG: carboxypeptidase-like regulatory domain-containing protein [Maribacter sp.]|nr:carboxypeptidase-like regulatory domain-containing protein [Maribacter sp.]